MSRVTSRFLVTVPKAIAERYGTRPGDEIDWVPAGDAIRIVPSARRMPRTTDSRARPLALFDQATERQRERQQGQTGRRRGTDRGWCREDLYGPAPVAGDEQCDADGQRLTGLSQAAGKSEG
jgi:bifunctional DNA-binding transcriptional regulator/antitoxin component of YhaV-PrlF toxin-antitoxin module